MTTISEFILERLLSITPEFTTEDIMDAVPGLFSTKTLAELLEDDVHDRDISRSKLQSSLATSQSGLFVWQLSRFVC